MTGRVHSIESFGLVDGLEALGIPYSLTDVLPPAKEEVRRAEEILRIK